MPRQARWAQNVDDTLPASVKRPNFSTSDLVLHLLRSWWLMLLVFLPIALAGTLAAMFLLPEEYEARSRLMVSIGDEYVYVPSVGTDNRAVAPEQEELVRAEVELLHSPTVAEMTLKELGPAQLYPELMEKCRADLSTKEDNPFGDESIAGVPAYCFQAASVELRKDFWADAAPKSRVIALGYRHKSAATSANALNQIVDSYLRYRSNLFSNSTDRSFEARRIQFENELQTAENAISKFLDENNIGDFETERQTVRQLYQSASADLRETQSRSRSVDGQLEIVRGQLRTVNPQQDLFVEDSSSETLVELKLEREDLLTRYTPNSRAVRDIDERIAQTEAFLKSQTGPIGLVRRGPNPTFTQIDTSAKTLEAEAKSLEQSQIEIKRQLSAIERRQKRLTDLEPAYLELLRRRDLLDQNMRRISERAAEERTRRQLFEDSVDNIRVMEEAIPPLKGRSLKFPVALLSLLFAAFTALMVGLIRSLSNNSFSTRRSVERTFGLPVFSSIKKR